MKVNKWVMADMLLYCYHLPSSQFRLQRRISTSYLALRIQILDCYLGKIADYKTNRNTDLPLLHGSSTVIGDQLCCFLNLHVWQWIRLIWYPTKARNIDNVPVFYSELMVWEHFHLCLKALTSSPDTTHSPGKVNHTVIRDSEYSFHWILVKAVIFVSMHCSKYHYS